MRRITLPWRVHLPLRAIGGYVLAVLMVAAAVVLRMVLVAVSGSNVPTLITFYPAVLVTALVAGPGPGLLAAALATLILPHWEVLFSERTAPAPVGRLAQAFFVIVNVFMCGVAAAYRRAQVKLQRQQEHLQNLVDGLQHQAAALEQSNRELEAFTYSTSHDLRAPLRTIDGFSQAVLEDYGDRLDETGRDYLRRLRSGAQRMGRLIDDLLRLSRISRADMHVSSVDLSTLAQEVMAGLQETDPERRSEIAIASDLRVAGDPSLLRILLQNLLGNAWKFTSTQPVARIAVYREAAPGQVGFCVRDNGVGFDMAHVDRLFLPFQRLHASEAFAGTGIGLTIVQRIAQRHGGNVWAESEIGAGATFHVLLPNGGVNHDETGHSAG